MYINFDNFNVDLGDLSPFYPGMAIDEPTQTGIDRPTRVQPAQPPQPSQPSSPSVSNYLDALRKGEGGYTDAIQKELVDQEYLPDIFITGEGEASGRAPASEDVYARAPVGSLKDIDVGEFTFNKTQKDFRKFNRYGKLSDDQLKAFQEELLPVLAGEMAIQQGENRQEYTKALMTSYERNPEVQRIYAKYGVSPARVTDDYGSLSLYDPFGFKEITLTDKAPGFSDYLGSAIKSFGLALAGGALLGPLAGKLAGSVAGEGLAGTALKGALTGAGTSAITGGDPLTGAITGGLGGVVDPIIAGADLGTIGTAAARGASSAAIAELTGGDPLRAGLMAAAMSLGEDAIDAYRAREGETPAETAAEAPAGTGEVPAGTGEAPAGTGEVPVDSSSSSSTDIETHMGETIDKIIDDIG